MVIDDVLNGKCESIRICLARISEEYANEPSNLCNPTKLDSITLNLQRVCEASIDLAMHLVKVTDLGIPQRSRDAFDLLHGANLLSEELANRMKKMVGFRNIAVHQYQQLNVKVIHSIIKQDLTDFTNFIAVAIKIIQGHGPS